MCFQMVISNVHESVNELKQNRHPFLERIKRKGYSINGRKNVVQCDSYGDDSRSPSVTLSFNRFWTRDIILTDLRF